jgi:hypothetical protein
MKPMEYHTQGEALTAAMELIGSTRKRLVVEQITNSYGNRRYCVFHPNGDVAITTHG